MQTNTIDQSIIQRQDIDYAFLFKGYTIIVFSNGSHEVVDLPLCTIEKALKSKCFFRVHRSYLVNMKRVRQMEVQDNRLMILMRGHALPVSRRKRKILLQTLSTVN